MTAGNNHYKAFVKQICLLLGKKAKFHMHIKDVIATHNYLKITRSSQLSITSK